MLSRKQYFPINWGPLAVFYILRFVKEASPEGVAQ
jgi:hypothetical protein